MELRRLGAPSKLLDDSRQALHIRASIRGLILLLLPLIPSQYPIQGGEMNQE
jgi:hypothetical protein